MFFAVRFSALTRALKPPFRMHHTRWVRLDVQHQDIEARRAGVREWRADAAAWSSVDDAALQCTRRGPDVGGACLGMSIDSSETRVVARLPTTQSVHAVNALRSPMQLAIQGQPTQQMPPPVPPPMPDRRQQQSPVCIATDGQGLLGNRPDPTVPPPPLMCPSDLPAHTGLFCCLPVAASPSFQADNLPAGALILLRWAKGSGCQPSCVTNNVLVIPDGSQLLEWDLTAAQQAALLNLIASASGTGGRSSRLNPARSTVTTCWR